MVVRDSTNLSHHPLFPKVCIRRKLASAELGPHYRIQGAQTLVSQYGMQASQATSSLLSQKPNLHVFENSLV